MILAVSVGKMMNDHGVSRGFHAFRQSHFMLLAVWQSIEALYFSVGNGL